MADHEFSAGLREAIWIAHAKKCAYTHELVDLASMHVDEQVHFPDLRIEYEEIDGRHDHVDVEVLTLHYRGEHGAAAARSGFSAYRGSSSRIGGAGGSGSRGGGRLGGFAEELLD